jgi:hypothetical protein
MFFVYVHPMSAFTLLLLVFLISVQVLAADSADKCPDGYYRVRAHPRSGYYKADGTYYRATTVSSSCKARSAAHIFWHDKLMVDRPQNWPNNYQKPEKWTDEYRERLLEAFEDVPQGLWAHDIKIYRNKLSRNQSNPAVHKNNLIVIYDLAFSEKHKLSRVLTHELAHNLWDKLELNLNKNYAKATGWERTFDPITKIKSLSGRRSGYVEKDGAFSVDEDFANNIEFFVFEPEVLQRTTPTAFKWIKDNLNSKLGK